MIDRDVDEIFPQTGKSSFKISQNWENSFERNFSLLNIRFKIEEQRSGERIKMDRRS